MTTEQLIDEIKQIVIQYQAEVERGRKAWPKSIKDRVADLSNRGLFATSIAEATGLPYGTILKWRPKNKVGAPRGLHASKFKEVAVMKQAPEPRSTTVPVHQNVGIQPAGVDQTKLITVTMTTPDGYSLKVDGIASALEILNRLRSVACS